VVESESTMLDIAVN